MTEEISWIKVAVLAAAYTALTYAIMPIAYLINQIRISDAMLIIPFHKKYGKSAVIGLTLGGFLANLVSPIQPWDLIFGPVTNLLVCLVIYYLGMFSRKLNLRRELRIILGGVGALIGALIIGLLIGYELVFLAPPELSGLSMGASYIEAVVVLTLSELIALFIGGLALLSTLLKAVPE
ncbi:MAG: QueT transporter family protein [Candidatus Njordarchaeales archaeon]